MGSTACGSSGNREPRTRDHGNMPQNGTVKNPTNTNQLAYVHIYIYIYINLDIDIYTYTYISIYICVYSNMYGSIPVHIRVVKLFVHMFFVLICVPEACNMSVSDGFRSVPPQTLVRTIHMHPLNEVRTPISPLSRIIGHNPNSKTHRKRGGSRR